jgi:hypothetical protein
LKDVTSRGRQAFGTPMRNALLVTILVATAACGAYRFPGQASGSGTVSGQVIATACGPVQPAAGICVPGPAANCPPSKPVGNTCGNWPIPGIELVFTNGDTRSVAKTDSAGDYSIELASGTWTVGTTNIMRIISGPQTLVVSDGASITANYVVDTGIRANNYDSPRPPPPAHPLG